MVNINSILKKYNNLLLSDLMAYIQSNIELESSDKRGTRNNTNTIRAFSTKTGLLPSFTRGNTNNIFEQSKLFQFRYGSKLPYAAIHEYGGSITQQITEKQRSFFWYKFYKEDSPMFRAMALSKEINIKIPARPYFNKGIAEWQKERQDDFVNDLLDEILKAYGYK